MNTRSLLAILATAVVGFLAGWVIWEGLGLMKYFHDHMTVAAMACERKAPIIAFYGVSNLFYAIMLVWVFTSVGSVKTAMKGMMTGGMLALLICVSSDFGMAAGSEMFTDWMPMVVDLLIGTVTGAIMGGTAGWMLGMGPKAEA